jgi:hypothetical protein
MVVGTSSFSNLIPLALEVCLVVLPTAADMLPQIYVCPVFPSVVSLRRPVEYIVTISKLFLDFVQLRKLWIPFLKNHSWDYLPRGYFCVEIMV